MIPWRLNLIVVLSVSAVTCAFFFGLLMPGLGELERQRAEVKALSAAVEAEQDLVGNVSETYASILVLEKQMENFRELVPRRRRFGEFLSSLSDQLRGARIRDYVVKPLPPLELVADQLPETVRLTAGTTILPVHVEFDADLEKVFDLLSRVDRMPRLSSVESMSLASADDRPGALHVKITLHTYYKPD